MAASQVDTQQMVVSLQMCEALLLKIGEMIFINPQNASHIDGKEGRKAIIGLGLYGSMNAKTVGKGGDHIRQVLLEHGIEADVTECDAKFKPTTGSNMFDIVVHLHEPVPQPFNIKKQEHADRVARSLNGLAEKLRLVEDDLAL